MRFQQFLALPLFEAKLDHADIPADNQNGTCYQDAMNYMMRHSKRGKTDILLCHGLVTGQGAIRGIVYNHAWVEKGGTVIDETVPIKIDKRVYYAMGNIKEKTVFRYTFDEMARKVTDFKTYGPWEKKLINNKY
jgi:hypothetical protein